jgi:hypothetical protein
MKSLLLLLSLIFIVAEASANMPWIDCQSRTPNEMINVRIQRPMNNNFSFVPMDISLRTYQQPNPIMLREMTRLDRFGAQMQRLQLENANVWFEMDHWPHQFPQAGMSYFATLQLRMNGIYTQLRCRVW